MRFPWSSSLPSAIAPFFPTRFAVLTYFLRCRDSSRHSWFAKKQTPKQTLPLLCLSVFIDTSPWATFLPSPFRLFTFTATSIVRPFPPCFHFLLFTVSSCQVLDDKNVRRRFRASNYQSTTRVKPFICTMPMRLDEGWNQIQFNLSDFTRRAYGTNYVETLRVQIHANCRIRRVYFSDRLYSEDELPAEFKLFLPIQKPQSKAIAQQAC